MNKKALGKSYKETILDLIGLGEYIVIRQQYRNRIANYENIEFNIALDNSRDSIVSCEQNIILDSETEIIGIGFFVCTEWEKNYEVIKCVDYNDEIFHVYIEACDLVEYGENGVIDVRELYNKCINEIVRERNVFVVSVEYFEKIKVFSYYFVLIYMFSNDTNY